MSRPGPGALRKPVTVNVPAGASDGGKLRFKGKGEPGVNGGPAGDLYVITRIKPHPYFSRDGADVVLDLPVGIAEAALGVSVNVPTPAGEKVKLKIPAGTQTRQDVPDRRQGRAEAQRRRSRRPEGQGRGGDAEAPERGPEGSARGVLGGVE